MLLRFSKTTFSDFTKNNQSLGLLPMEGKYLQIGGFGTLGGNVLGATIQGGWLFPIADETNRPASSPFYITIGLNLNFW
jgi:hypothetical protein